MPMRSVNELIDGVTISPLRILRSEAVQDCAFGVFKVGQAQDGLGDVASSSGTWLLFHDRWPPNHRSMIRVVPRCEARVARHPPKDDYEAAEDSNVVRANGQIKKLLRRVRYHF